MLWLFCCSVNIVAKHLRRMLLTTVTFVEHMLRSSTRVTQTRAVTHHHSIRVSSHCPAPTSLPLQPLSLPMCPLPAFPAVARSMPTAIVACQLETPTAVRSHLPQMLQSDVHATKSVDAHSLMHINCVSKTPSSQVRHSDAALIARVGLRGIPARHWIFPFYCRFVGNCVTVRRCPGGQFGATGNAGVESAIRSKMQGWKMQEWKMREYYVAEVENAGVD